MQNGRMDERQRMLYLDAMGIPAFVPRYILGVAKPSVQARLPVDLGVGVDEVAGSHSTKSETAAVRAKADPAGAEKSTKGSGPQAVQALLDDGAFKRQPPRSLRDDNESPSSGESGGALQSTEASQNDIAQRSRQDTPTEALVAPFELSIWSPCKGVMILDERQVKAALPTQKLLQNLLQALGLNTPLAAPEVLQWPMPGLPKEPTSMADASTMIRGFLSGRVAAQPLTQLWLMGAVPQSLVLGAEQAGSPKPVVTVDEFNALSFKLPSLTDLLLEPQRKAHVWSILCSHALTSYSTT